MNPWRDQVRLEGGNVALLPLETAHAESIAEVSGDGRLWELFYTRVPAPGDVKSWLETALAEKAAGRAMPFVVETEGRIVGATRYLRMNEAYRRLEIGATFYAKSVQRSAVNTQCKLLLLSHAFEVMGCNVVQIRTDWLNHASQRAIERLGAKRDGVLRNHQIAADGRLRDIACYSIISGEWAGVKQNLEFLLSRHREPAPE
ncbi:GNAT family N-acetyltransferase [Sphingosinicella soli]|uniref:RimJ/RimL family protein N-acetyltransferase n=1 Tax=Sphingosinicella soli TaxID=333708 RepID=A0A7W7F5A0_9SPHN|nr:GNAT family N-acetyltransferase [Sphingosinicella soli]MBB4630484.1 RimJ/RimL family protein N-acetyltransferase [Sphingosinicella soli]